VSTRSYRSTLREDSARRTRQLIAEAACRLFLERGYAETSMAAVARAAAVSGQTVYNVFGSKAGLLKHVYDVTLVGDDEPVPFAERPEVQALYRTEDPAEFLHGYFAIGLVLLDRLGPLVHVVMAGAASGNADLVAHLETMARERLQGVTMVVRRLVALGPLRDGVDEAEARDVIWSLNSVEVWQLLVGQRGWSGERYVDWLGRTAAEALLPPR
jgi:AcrR family transcriptional regulator